MMARTVNRDRLTSATASAVPSAVQRPTKFYPPTSANLSRQRTAATATTKTVDEAEDTVDDSDEHSNGPSENSHGGDEPSHHDETDSNLRSRQLVAALAQRHRSRRSIGDGDDDDEEDEAEDNTTVQIAGQANANPEDALQVFRAWWWEKATIEDTSDTYWPSSSIVADIEPMHREDMLAMITEPLSANARQAFKTLQKEMRWPDALLTMYAIFGAEMCGSRKFMECLRKASQSLRSRKKAMRVLKDKQRARRAGDQTLQGVKRAVEWAAHDAWEAAEIAKAQAADSEDDDDDNDDDDDVVSDVADNSVSAQTKLAARALRGRPRTSQCHEDKDQEGEEDEDKSEDKDPECEGDEDRAESEDQEDEDEDDGNVDSVMSVEKGRNTSCPLADGDSTMPELDIADNLEDSWIQPMPFSETSTARPMQRPALGRGDRCSMDLQDDALETPSIHVFRTFPNLSPQVCTQQQENLCTSPSLSSHSHAPNYAPNASTFTDDLSATSHSHARNCASNASNASNSAKTSTPITDDLSARCRDHDSNHGLSDTMPATKRARSETQEDETRPLKRRHLDCMKRASSDAARASQAALQISPVDALSQWLAAISADDRGHSGASTLLKIIVAPTTTEDVCPPNGRCCVLFRDEPGDTHTREGERVEAPYVACAYLDKSADRTQLHVYRPIGAPISMQSIQDTMRVVGRFDEETDADDSEDLDAPWDLHEESYAPGAPEFAWAALVTVASCFCARRPTPELVSFWPLWAYAMAIFRGAAGADTVADNTAALGAARIAMSASCPAGRAVIEQAHSSHDATRQPESVPRPSIGHLDELRRIRAQADRTCAALENLSTLARELSANAAFIASLACIAIARCGSSVANPDASEIREDIASVEASLEVQRKQSGKFAASEVARLERQLATLKGSLMTAGSPLEDVRQRMCELAGCYAARSLEYQGEKVLIKAAMAS